MICTSYYASKRITAEYAAIRISVGHPRWRLAYEIAGNIPVLMPARAWLGMDADAYEVLYRAKLDAASVGVIRDAIRTIAGLRPSVLLCFESLADGKWCHRRMFAEWWLEKTGEEIPELK